MLIFDIETGPLSEETLRSLYQEPTYEEFAANCDQRWKEETKREKFETAKVDGWAKFVDRAALSPVTGQVLAIGVRSDSGKSAIVDCSGGNGNESKSIAAFWHKYEQCREKNSQLVGFNIFGFDVPFLVRRSWLIGIDVPDSVFDPTGRYPDRLFVDLLARWRCGNREDSIKLDALARALGVGHKTEGVNGKDFHLLWAQDRAKAEEYLQTDLEITAKCAQRMGVI